MKWLRAQVTFTLITWLGIIVLFTIAAFLLQALFRVNQIFAYGVNPFQKYPCATASLWSTNELGNIFVIALTILGAALLIWSAISFFRVLFSTVRFNLWVRSLRKESLYGGEPIDILHVQEPLLFCYGLIKHRVAISEGLIDNTPVKELSAMVQHERHHQQSKDPRKIFCIQWLEQTFFFIPGYRELAKLFRLVMEVEADQSIEEPKYIQRALSRFLGDSWNRRLAQRRTVSVAYFSITEARLDILLGRTPKISERKLAWGVLVPAIILSIFIFFSQSSGIFAQEYYMTGSTCEYRNAQQWYQQDRGAMCHQSSIAPQVK